RTVHVPDIGALLETEFRDATQTYGAAARFQAPFRTVLATPLVHEGEPLGVLSMSHEEVCPFTESQIRLLETFARQAAIAIHNVRLFEQLQQSNADLREALAQQTAIAGVLQAISRTAFDLQTVLDTLCENAARLLAIDEVYLVRVDGERPYHASL